MQSPSCHYYIRNGQTELLHLDKYFLFKWINIYNRSVSDVLSLIRSFVITLFFFFSYGTFYFLAITPCGLILFQTPQHWVLFPRSSVWIAACRARVNPHFGLTFGIRLMVVLSVWEQPRVHRICSDFCAGSMNLIYVSPLKDEIVIAIFWMRWIMYNSIAMHPLNAMVYCTEASALRAQTWPP